MRRCPPTLAVLILASPALLSARIAAAQSAAQSAAEPPAFAAQVAGRAALTEGGDALMNAPRLSVTTRWFELTINADHRVDTRTGLETLLLDRSTQHLRLIRSSGDGPPVARSVCDGATLLNATSTPKPAFFYLPLSGDAATLSTVLQRAHVDNGQLSVVADLALFGKDENRGSVLGMVYRDPDGSVLVQPPRQDVGNETVDTVYRFRFSALHLPTQVERWVTATNKDNHQTHTLYRQEQSSYLPFTATPALFRTKAPAGYAEVPPPSVAPPSLPDGPDSADTKAHALLERWRRAWARFASYNGRVHIHEWQQAQTKESTTPDGSGDREAMVTVTYLRPGKLFVSTEPFGKPGSFTVKQTFVGDGTRLVIFQDGQKRGEAGNPADDARLHDVGRGAGLWDFSEVLPRILEDPREIQAVAEKATYRGVLPLPDGGTAEAVTLVRSFTDAGPRRHGQSASALRSQETITLYFDPRTGLPVRSAFLLHRFSADGTLPRDLPPDEYRVADFQNVQLNQEPSATLFDASKVK